MTEKTGKVDHGFLIEKSERIDEINGEGTTYTHTRSGSKLFFLRNQDPNKVFNISFGTPPIDDCGTPHILEHSILCGSKNYPARESFIELAKGSLKTFINAFTFPDKTMYPVASMNTKDFMNLVLVYMDAVFHPNLLEKEDIFLQEGWHYELDDQGNLSYQGVVYNEMKGVYSSPDSLLRRKAQDYLFPDTCYGLESGGDPDKITNLNYYGFKDYYLKHYYPGNSKIFLYGSFTEAEYQEILHLLDRKLLEVQVGGNNEPIEIKHQEPFTERRVLRVPVPAEEEGGEKAYYGFSWCTGSSLDSELAFSLDVLSHILGGTPSSPLKRFLIEKGIARDVIVSHDAGILQPTFSIYVKGGKKGKLAEVEDAVLECLETLSEKGIEAELLEASMNFVEFQFREADFGGYPKGLIYGLQVAETWLYGGEPSDRLKFNDRLKKVRAAMPKRYFEELIKKYLIQNAHGVSLELYEESGLALKNSLHLEESLREKKQNFSESGIEKIRRDMEHLKEIQTAGDTTEDLRKLPLLRLSEISRIHSECPRYIREGNQVFTDLETAGIYYESSLYTLRLQDKGNHPGFARIATELLGNVNIGEKDYSEIQRRILKDTGGIEFGSGLFPLGAGTNSYIPYLSMKGRALSTKQEEFHYLKNEILTGTKGKVDVRFSQIIGEMLTRIEMALAQEGHSFVLMKLASSLFSWGKHMDDTKGIGFYHLLKAIVDKKIIPEEIEKRIQFILDQFHSEPMLRSIVGISKEEIKNLNRNIFASPEERGIRMDGFLPNQKRIAYHTNGRVNYCGLGYDFGREGYKYSGHMRVLNSVLRYGYLWNEIRVKGGAYGAFFSVDRTGFMSMVSYRDPRIAGTLDDFRRASEYLYNFKPSEEEMRKYIIGTMSGVDMPRTNSNECDRALELTVKGISMDMLQREREEILDTTPEIIQSFGELLEAMAEKGSTVVIGNREKIEEVASIFDEIHPLIF